MKLRTVISVACVLVLSVSLCACGPQGTGSSSADPVSDAPVLTLIRVEDYAAKGEIYGCEFALGTSPDDIKAAYHYGETVELPSAEPNDSEEQEETGDAPLEGDVSELTIVEGDTVKMTTGAARYYYRSALADEGIAFIACFDDPFSYYIGLTTKDEILRTVDAEPIFNDIAPEDDLFFFYGVPENVWKIQYQFGDYCLSFFFEGEYLSVTTIYSVAHWVDQPAES